MYFVMNLYTVLLSANEAEITPAGWLIIIAIFGSIIVGVLMDKRHKADFKEQFQKFISEKRVEGNDNIFISGNRELIIATAGFDRVGYNSFKLDDIAYIMTFFDTDFNSASKNKYAIILYNGKKKRISGEMHVSVKKSTRKAIGQFTVSTKEEADMFYNLIKKHVPDVRRVGKFFKEYGN